MNVIVKKDDNTFVVTCKTQLEAFKADGWVEVGEREDEEERKPKRKRED